MGRPLYCLPLVMATISCSRPAPIKTGSTEPPWSDRSPHRVSDVRVNGVSLNLLDWGGTGPALVLIHGLGDSPHIFDDLAPKLTPSYRVLAYARRGHARSEKKGPYDNLTLTEDLRQLMDTLGISRAALLGWSMGGSEITELAGHDRHRVSALIYLDAAYDWSEPALGQAFAALPVPITATGEDTKSVDALRAWYRKVWLPDLAWPDAWEAHIRDLVEPAPDGSLRYRQTDSVNALMFESLVGYRKDYRKIAVPALALYAPDFLPTNWADTTMKRQVAEWEQAQFSPYREKSIRRFRAEVRQAVDTLLPNTSHASIGVVDVDGLAKLIEQFLRDRAKW